MAELPRYEKLVAVTDAVFFPLPFNVWCFQEGCSSMGSPRQKHFGGRVEELRPKIWGVRGVNIGHHWNLKWEWADGNWLEANRIDQVIAMIPWAEDVWRDRYGRLREQGGNSFFYAIARLIASGEKEIDIYGCDMEGIGNYDPRDGRIYISRRPDGWWETRWKQEKVLFDDIKQAAERNGVALNLVARATDSSEPGPPRVPSPWS